MGQKGGKEKLEEVQQNMFKKQAAFNQRPNETVPESEQEEDLSSIYSRPRQSELRGQQRASEVSHGGRASLKFEGENSLSPFEQDESLRVSKASGRYSGSGLYLDSDEKQ